MGGFMDKKLSFQILGLSETKDEEKIRQAYLSLLKVTNPEDDPEGFKRLRESYEEALRFAGQREEEKETVPQGEVGQWMRRVRETYRNIFLRNDEDAWKELFEEPVCIGFDTFLEARGQVLAFLSMHSFLPQKIWRLLDRTFHVMDDFEALKEDFPVNFLKHIEYHIETEDFLDYNLFEEGDGGYEPENDEETDEYLREFFQIRSRLEEDDTKGVWQELSDMRRHGLYHPYEDVERLRYYIRTKEQGKGRGIAERLIESYPDDSYVQVWTGKLFYDTDEAARGFEQWQAVLEKEPDYYMAKYFALFYLVQEEKWFEAGEYVHDLIRVNRRDEELSELQKQINGELVPVLREALDKGEAYRDLSGKELRAHLGWNLFDINRYEDVLALLAEDKEMELQEEGLELKAWSLYRLERYEEAIPVYEAHLKSVEAGGYDAEKKASKASQSHRLLGVCLFAVGEREEGERETRIAIEMETDARIRLDCKYYLADRYLYFKEYERAIEACDVILSEDEGYFPAYLVRQEACYYLDKGQQVVDDYYRAIEIFDGFYKPYFYAASVFYDHRQYKDALGVMERAHDNQVEFPLKMRFQEAKILRMMAENEEERKRALEIIDALITETEDSPVPPDPEDRDAIDRAELLFERGLLYEADEKMEGAIALVREAIKMDPTESYYTLVLGNLLRDVEQYDKALSEYKKVEKIYSHTEFYFGMGVCFQMAEDWSQAIVYYTKAVEREEFYRDTNLRLYRCYEKRYCIEYKQSDYDAALVYINKQMEVTEARGYRLWDRGFLYNDAMETALAIADYEEALKTIDESDRYIVLQNIGYTYKSDRQFAKAYEAYRKAVECMEPKNASPKGYQGMAECQQKLKDYAKAIALCREGLAVFPDNEELWDILSDCYEETDRLQEAREVEEQRARQVGNTTAYRDHLSFIYLKEGGVGIKPELWLLFKVSEKRLQKSEEDREELAQLYEDWGGRLAEIHQYEEAVKKYEASVALRKEGWDRFDGERYLAQNYYMMGNYEEAAKHARKVLDCMKRRNTTPEDYMSYYGYVPVRMGQMAWIYLALGDKEKAKELLGKMEKIRPCAACRYTRCFESSLWLGYYYYTEKEYEKAAALMEETLKRNFDALEAKFLLDKIKKETKKGRKGLFR